ncbi:hypothetical protein BASA81_000679 [Batrachochytrium salamandrivorans]|nr:hypothetical protein BASA81_000679 [Batrachochytrium salamandrivorans]
MTSLLKQTLGGLTEVSALLLKYDGSLAQYALISHQIDALSVQTTKLVENTQKQVLDRNDVWVPMYGPNHVARVDSAREELARLVLEFELLVRPVDKEEKVAKEEVPVVFAQPRIVQQSLAAQRLAVDQQARNNLALAQQAKNRVKKDAVDLEMARMAPGGGELRSFEELAGLLTTDARLALGAILEEICRRPENAQFRTLKTSNAAVAALLESSEWMRPALRSLGFGPKFVPLRDHREDEEETLAYFLPEPNLDTDFDAWSVWFDSIRAGTAVLRKS